MPDLAYSHSIVNEPFLQFNINGLIVGVRGNTMLRNFLKRIAYAYKRSRSVAYAAPCAVQACPQIRVRYRCLG